MDNPTQVPGDLALQGDCIQASHFGDVIGLEHLEAPEGSAIIELSIKPHLCNRYGTIHGGVIMSLIDAAGLWAGVPKAGLPSRTATVSLNCDFMRAAHFDSARTLRASADVIKRGRSLYFSSIIVRANRDGPIIASGQGVYAISSKSDKDGESLIAT
ncbi:MAG: PaaI family thioesterase [Pseudomonadota bacterium]|nr:PaaI family thioesterase [Pseudomonadota bacterium]